MSTFSICNTYSFNVVTKGLGRSEEARQNYISLFQVIFAAQLNNTDGSAQLSAELELDTRVAVIVTVYRNRTYSLRLLMHLFSPSFFCLGKESNAAKLAHDECEQI